MPDIRSLTSCEPARLAELIAGGYTSRQKYAVSVEGQAGDDSVRFSLRLVDLPQPYVKVFPVTPADLERYAGLLPLGFSLGLFDDGRLVGLALGEPQAWNRTLWLWELHIQPAWQRRGWGLKLVDALAEKAASAGLRALVVETQTTNVPAIRFYRAAGFAIEGIDLSYYTNHDYPLGEMALFMKRRLDKSH